MHNTDVYLNEKIAHKELIFKWLRENVGTKNHTWFIRKGVGKAEPGRVFYAFTIMCKFESDAIAFKLMWGNVSLELSHFKAIGTS